MKQSVDRFPVFTAGERLNGFGESTMRLEHHPGSLVGSLGLDLTELFHEDLFEVRTQDLVIAVATTVIRCRGKDLPSLELLEDLLTAAALQKGVADGAADAGQHAGSYKEAAQVRRQLVQDIAGQVLASDP